MNSELYLAGAVILLAFWTIAQMVLMWFIVRQSRKHKVPEELLREGKAKTQTILARAIQQANKILVSAQLKGIQLVAEEKLSGEELSAEFKKHLDEIERILTDHMEQQAKLAEDRYAQFIVTTEQSIADHILHNQKTLEGKAEAMIERTQGLLTNFAGELEAHIKGEVEKEMDTARAELIHYRQQRMRVIDERIIDILEEVLRAVLDKTLTLAEHSELIYKALEEAKRGNAFSKAAAEKQRSSQDTVVR